MLVMPCRFVAELQVWFDASTGNKTYRFTDWQEWLVDTHPDSEAVMEADDEVGTVPDYESTTVGDDESSLTKSASTVHGGTCIDCKSVRASFPRQVFLDNTLWALSRSRRCTY
jgi:hypothetical protein